jgi:hypothetical protein
MKQVIAVGIALSLAPAGGMAGDGADESVPTVRMTVRPAPAPQPALRYQFLPEVLGQTRGNAALLYYRMLERIDGKKEGEKVVKWLATPPKALPRAEVRALLARYAAVLDEARRAARCEQCDWQLPIRAEGFNLVLPSLSKFRHLARVLAVQARMQIGAGRLEEAATTLQTGFALARHQAEGATLIHGLVAAAIAQLMAEQVRELAQARDAPNLYWALTALPRPLIDLRKGVQHESAGVFLGFPALRGLAEGQVTLQQWRKIVSGLSKTTGQEMLAGVLSTALAIKMYPEGKRYLAGRGRSREEIEKMPVVQVVATYAIGSYLQLRDDTFKWFSLPYWQAHEGLRQASRAVVARRMSVSGALFAMFVPALGRAYFVSARLDREIAALRCIGAVRLHAAANGGKLPPGLDEVKIVPVPLNPVTGKAFGYEVTGRTFRLDAAGPPGAGKQDSQRYVVTVAPK